ncbi:hypothetical protein [Gallaecimonas xiamenensis]|uniref:hypothetical protein n=1 Tax=Gallaecimonas xiamenensis TaxID=1207039 RepID=UPI0004B519A3|nr:hypothetical protein [Gallaecimonas xiamenensis]
MAVLLDASPLSSGQWHSSNEREFAVKIKDYALWLALLVAPQAWGDDLELAWTLVQRHQLTTVPSHCLRFVAEEPQGGFRAKIAVKEHHGQGCPGNPALSPRLFSLAFDQAGVAYSDALSQSGQLQQLQPGPNDYPMNPSLTLSQPLGSATFYYQQFDTELDLPCPVVSLTRQDKVLAREALCQYQDRNGDPLDLRTDTSSVDYGKAYFQAGVLHYSLEIILRRPGSFRQVCSLVLSADTLGQPQCLLKEPDW